MTYSPYLVPLLARTSALPVEATGSPAEEERFLDRLGDAVWQDLSIRVREAYGHAFLTELPKDAPMEVLERIADAGQRLLLTRLDDRITVLLEHPGGIWLADQRAPEDAIILLARPRLFLALWREGKAAPVPRKAHAPPVLNASSLTRTLLVEMAQRPGLSDWHLIPARDHYASMMRLDGRLVALAPLGRDEALTRIQSICSSAGMDGGLPRNAQEGRLRLPSGAGALTARASLVPAHFGPALTIRFLPDDRAACPPVEALGMDAATLAAVHSHFAKQEGLWLVAGPTGSGKSTTLHALLRRAADNNEKVISIEDPVERTLDGVQQMSVGTPPGLTYAVALKASLRQAPNTLMIGEIRDPETAAIALQAARAGHRVLSTLHARDTRGLLGRLGDLGQAAGDVRRLQPVIVHQRLLPRTCPTCRVRGSLPPEWASLFRAHRLSPPACVWTGGGCGQCHQGYQGRQALFALGSVENPDETARAFLAAARNPLEQGDLGLGVLGPFLSPEARLTLASAAPTGSTPPAASPSPHLRENGSGLPSRFRLTQPS